MKFSSHTVVALLLATAYTTTNAFTAISPSPKTTTSKSRSLLSMALRLELDESAARDVQTFNDQWVDAVGIQRHPGFTLNPTMEGAEGEDYSMYASQDLPANSPILSVPAGVWWSSNNLKVEMGGAADECVQQLGRLGAGSADEVAQFYLFYKLLLEYEQGDQSPWHAWMNSMPRLYFNSVSMTSFCYECLPPLVFALSRTERVKFDNFCDVLKKDTYLSSETKRNKKVLQWAYNVVSTRSISYPMEDGSVDRRLVPMADYLNHGTETEVVLDYDAEGNCVAYTTTDVPAGAPLRISYADPTNPSHLFATYGFLDETSPATFCKIMNLQATPQLKDMGYDFSKMLFYKDTGDVSEQVWDVLLYQNLAANRDVQEAFYQAHMTGDAETKNAMHQAYFGETAQALKKHVDTFLDQLDTLSAKGDGKSMADHPRLPLILKHNEFVKQTFLMVKANIDPMVQQAVGVEEPVYY